MDADEGLSHALAGASPQAITARYGFDYDTDYSHIKWAFIPNVMLLNLNYVGADHHICLEFNNNSQYYMFTEEELQQPKAFRSLAENGITLQLEAIYDGSTLIQRFGYENGNYMHIIFAGQNCVDSTTVKQDSIAISLHSIFQRDVMCNYDVIRKDSNQQQYRLSFVRKEQGLTRGISPNAVKMQKFDPYRKKFTDMRIIETIGSHISR